MSSWKGLGKREPSQGLTLGFAAPAALPPCVLSPLLLPRSLSTQSSPGRLGGAGCEEDAQSKNLNLVFSSHTTSLCRWVWAFPALPFLQPGSTSSTKWEFFPHQLIILAGYFPGKVCEQSIIPKFWRGAW